MADQDRWGDDSRGRWYRERDAGGDRRGFRDRRSEDYGRWGAGFGVEDPGLGSLGFPGGGYAPGGYGREGYSRYAPEERGAYPGPADEASSWSRDRDALERREPDHRGRGPKGYKRSDQRIQEDVNDRLYDDPYVDASEIDVSVSGGEVTLSGTVDSRNARRRAESLAEQVSGVTHVQNNLRVRQAAAPHGGAAAPDVPAAEDPTRVGGFGEAIAYAANPGTTGAGGGSRGTEDDTRRSG
ncbi:MAG TPA: BON domain-containing protein [Geminicoccaceae bacterium]|nr:BON domain-containing protein [Geminicoccaceae bacterium]